jgi:subtilase family serine protease
MSQAMQTLVFALLVAAVTAGATAQQDRIINTIDPTESVVLKHNVTPQAQPENDAGPLDPSQTLTGIRVMFKLSATQNADLKQLLAEQQTPSSPNYHKWLTPRQYADRFGLSPHDIAKITSWLKSQGLQVTEIAHGRGWIVFSGTVAQVQNAFHTQLHRYTVNGETHFANSTAPSIPKALAGVVSGLRGLNDFYPKPATGTRKVVPLSQLLPSNPDYTSGTSTFLAPDDLATIYDIAQLYSAGYDGTGEAIAVVGQSDIHTTDLTSFWTLFSLTPPTVNQIIDPNTGDPGINDAEVEADLDLETVSGVARNVTIYYVFGKSADDAAAYIIDNHTTVPVSVISESFGICEATAGSTYLNQQETIAAQGNTEGITWVASSGDTGAANCEPNNGTISSATTGLAVSEPASLPGVTGVGGNEFSGDVGNQSQYWNTTNTSTLESAKSYIPEMAWNDSDITGNGPVLDATLAASGGGASAVFTKPSWQVGPGVPADSARDVPDVSMTASANHDGYLIFCSNTGDGCPSGGGQAVYGGTSAATPVFSSILILLNHYLVKNGIQSSPGLSNVNQTLYELAKGSSSPFHDITTGSNIVPCTNPSPNCPTTAPFQFGYSAATGYDQVTGLGSVDAYNFVTTWQTAALTPTTTSVGITPQSVTVGTSVTLKATIAPAPPNGETITFVDTTSGSTLGTGATSSGVASFTSATIAGGTYNVVAKYPGDTTLAASISAASALNVQDFTLSPTTLTINVPAPGQNGSGTINLGFLGGLTQAPTFSCTGLPSESTCTLTAASATAELVTIGTTASSRLYGPLGRGNGMFYALLFPGLLGAVLSARSRKRRMRSVLALLALLAVLTLWLPACGGGSSTPHNPGTPVGQSNVTVTATESGITHTVSVTLNVQ